MARMRMLKSTTSFAVACLALLATASAQQLVSPSTTDYELRTRGAASEEPRPFSPRGAIEARPLPSAYGTAQQATSQRPRMPQPPVNFRLASSEEPISRQSDQQGRAPL